jgi:hypothetical protein
VRNSRAIVLSLVPMALAAAGAWFDERTHLGFTTWRTACRAAGFAPRSLAIFTLELLPVALAGALAGGLVVLLAGVLARRGDCPASALAAHGGCVLGMAVGLVLCVLAVPVPLVLALEGALAAAIAAWLFGHFRPARNTASVATRTRSLTSA